MKKDELTKILKNASFDINITIPTVDCDDDSPQMKTPQEDGAAPPFAILRKEMTPRELISTISLMHYLVQRLAVKLAQEAREIDPSLLGVDYFKGKNLWTELEDLGLFDDNEIVKVEIRKDGIHLYGDKDAPEIEDVPDFLTEFLDDQDVLDENLVVLIESDKPIRLDL